MAAQPVIGAYATHNLFGPYYNAGAPTNGTNAVQTLTIGGSPTAGAGSTFQLGFDGLPSAAIAWSATNATLLANIQAALDAMPNLGSGWIVAAAASLTAGVGTITLTATAGDVQVKLIPVFTIVSNNLTGTSPTLGITNTTPGVDATHRRSQLGALVIDTTNKFLYQNTGSAQGVPNWTKVGVQS